MCGALEEELAAMRASEAARRIPVHSGHPIGRAGGDWLYTFALAYPVALPDDVPLRIDLPSGETCMGQLVAASSFEVTVSSGSQLPSPLGSAYLVMDASFILEQLIQRLCDLDEERCELPLTLFGFDSPISAASSGGPQLPDEEANEFQLAAIEAALERDVTYVWGPPGTGKTTALALIGEALVRRGLRVLAVASTNVAVDNAVLALSQRLAGVASVVRLGTPQLAALRDTVPASARPKKELVETMPLFPNAVPALSPASGRERPGEDAGEQPVRVLPARRLPDLADEAQRLRTLRQAMVVGTTLSRVALAPELAVSGFDAVLLDEASAAPLPAVFTAAALARRKIVVLGDPKQLPPVAVSAGPLARRWLKRDVFAQAELEDDDERAVLLREQYRMHPDISRLANELVYGGRLVDGLRRGRDGGARLIDTSPEGGRCIRLDGSRQNEAHAHRAVQLARELLQQQTDPVNHERPVAIITPYRAQARLIWRLLRDARLERSVDVGTVHRFQGLERQAIIFDTVEAEPERPSPFVSGGYGSEAMRLINVAVTRARTHLVVLANVEYLWGSLRRGSTLLGLLQLLQGAE